MNKKISIIIFSLLVLSLGIHPYGYSQKSQESQKPVKLLEIEVRSGDTLYKFADRYLDDPNRWPDLLEYNKIPSGDPNLILPGDKLQVPVALVKDEIADIVYIKNNVRMRRKEAPAWKEAGLYERMYPEDGIRTAKNSFAQIKYLVGGSANINENSLVFLRPDKKRDDVIKLEVGELRARDIKVLTASASIDPEKGSEYSAKVDEDKTTTLSVFKGKVDFISSGKMVTVNEGFMSMAELNQPPMEPIELPEPPKFKEQENAQLELKKEEKEKKEEVITTGKMDSDFLLNKIDFNDHKKRETHIESVHVQVAKDKEFTRIAIDKEVKKADPEKWKEQLNDGVYWWRASYINSLGVEGKFSDPIKFTVDTRPPKLFISYPGGGETVRKKIFTVVGKTEKEVEVTVNDKPVKVDEEGNFVAAVNVKFGQNEITVNAMDSQYRTTIKKIKFEGVPVIDEGKGEGALMTVAIITSVVSITAIILAVLK